MGFLGRAATTCFVNDDVQLLKNIARSNGDSLGPGAAPTPREGVEEVWGWQLVGKETLSAWVAQTVSPAPAELVYLPMRDPPLPKLAG